MSLRKHLRGREVIYDPTTGRITNQRNVFLALPEEATWNPPVKLPDSHLVYESGPEAEDSESRMVLSTPPSQRSPTLTRAAQSSPAPQAS